MITGVITGKIIAINSGDGKIIVDVGETNLMDRFVTIHSNDLGVHKKAASLYLQMASFYFINKGRCTGDVECEPFVEKP